MSNLQAIDTAPPKTLGSSVGQLTSLTAAADSLHHRFKRTELEKPCTHAELVGGQINVKRKTVRLKSVGGDLPQEIISSPLAEGTRKSMELGEMDAKWQGSDGMTDSFNDVKSFITNQINSLMRLPHSDGSVLQNKVSSVLYLFTN